MIVIVTKRWGDQTKGIKRKLYTYTEAFIRLSG